MVSADLLNLGRVRAVADRLGWTVVVPERKTDITQLLLDEATKVVLVDLHHPRFDPVETLRLVRGTRWDTVLAAFGHHTDTAALERAKREGAKEIWANSQVQEGLARLLSAS